MPRGGHDIPVSGTHLKGTQWLRRVDPTVGHLKGTPWSRRVWTPQCPYHYSVAHLDKRGFNVVDIGRHV